MGMIITRLSEALTNIAIVDAEEFFKIANTIMETRRRLIAERLKAEGRVVPQKNRAKIIPLVVNVDDTERN